MTLTPTPAAPSGEQIRFRFFKNLVEAERRKVFEVFGVIPEGSKDRLNHSIEALLLKRMLNGFRAAVSQAAPERVDDQVMRERDSYQETADKLAAGIAEHFGQDIGEHSSANCPWANALEILNTKPEFAPCEGSIRALAAPSGAPKQEQSLRLALRKIADCAMDVIHANNSTEALQAVRALNSEATNANAVLAAASTVQSAPAPSNDAERLQALRDESDRRHIEARHTLATWDKMTDAKHPPLTVQSAPVLPKGYKLVPIEPTDAMDEAARAECHRMSGVIDPVIHIWDVMLAAAPEVGAAQSTPVQVEGQQEQTLQPSCDSALHAEPAGRVDANGGDFLPTREVHEEIVLLSNVMRHHPQLKSVIGREALLMRCVRKALATVAQPQSAGSARQGGEHAPEIVQAGALPVAAAPEQKP